MDVNLIQPVRGEHSRQAGGTWKELRTERESVIGNQFIHDSVGFNEFHEELGDRHFTFAHSDSRHSLSENSEKTSLTVATYTIETNA